jgi:hypothetical protein
MQWPLAVARRQAADAAGQAQGEGIPRARAWPFDWPDPIPLPPGTRGGALLPELTRPGDHPTPARTQARARASRFTPLGSPCAPAPGLPPERAKTRRSQNAASPRAGGVIADPDPVPLPPEHVPGRGSQNVGCGASGLEVTARAAPTPG